MSRSNFTGNSEQLRVKPLLHFPYQIATLGHLGLIYLDALILFVGTVLSYKALRS